MLVIILLLICGTLTGFLLRRFRMRFLPLLLTVLVCLLLFALGLEAGANQTIMNNLPALGIEALVMAVAAVTGSCLMAALLWRLK